MSFFTRSQSSRRAGAFAGFVALSIPFGIAVHLLAELVEFGSSDASLAFSQRHSYLVWLGAGSFAALLWVARFTGFADARRMAAALPFGGRGAAFFAVSSLCQFGVFAVTQAAEGSPMDHGAVALGLLAAIVASLGGGAVLAFAGVRIVRAAFELVWFVTRASDAAAQHGTSRHALEHKALVAPSASLHFFISTRPPPQIILTR